MWEKFGILKNPGCGFENNPGFVKKPGVLKNPGFVQCGENQGFVDIGLIVDLEKDKSIKTTCNFINGC